MLTGRRGEINSDFVVSEGLLHALFLIRGPLVSWRDWGIKAVVGAEGGTPTPGQSYRARRKDGITEYEGGDESGQGKMSNKRPYQLSEPTRLSKPALEPSVKSLKRYRVA